MALDLRQGYHHHLPSVQSVECEGLLKRRRRAPPLTEALEEVQLHKTQV